jgi:hypothetical protein
VNTPHITNGHELSRASIAAFMDASLYHSLSGLIQQLYPRPTVVGVRSIVVTSPHGSSGVSYLASCLATLIGEEFGAAVLVDGEALEAFAKAGKLPTRNEFSPVRHTRLWIFGSNTFASGERSASVDSVSFEDVVKALLKEFEFVIIDAPAIADSGIAESLAPHVDGSILVVIPHVTEVWEISKAKKKLTAGGARLFGAIYNNSGEEGPDLEKLS